MSSYNTLCHSERLLWVERSPNKWWPALRFENHGEALKVMGGDLDGPTKTRLTIQFLKQPSTPVIRLVGTNEFINLDENNIKTLDFFQHIVEFHNGSNPELEEPMRIVLELMKQDIADNGEKEPYSSEEEEEEEVKIDADDSWDDVWSKLKQMGWKKKRTKRGNECWVFPGGSRSSGVHGHDYFLKLQELKEYVRDEYGWKGSISEEEETVSTTTAKKTARTKRKRQEEKDRIWGRPKKQQVVSTPENQKTKPQDPGVPLLDDSDDESWNSNEDLYNWTVLWDKLKAAGWTAVRAGRYNVLHDWYYVRPRRSVAEGEMGTDYFLNASEVIDFVRSQDKQDGLGPKKAKASSVVIMPSPRKRSRKIRAPPKEELSDAAVMNAPKSKSAPKKKKDWWFHTEPLPSYREVWSILHHKLHFQYSNGCYKLPSGDEVFATDLEMRCYLVEHGIPNLEQASEEDREMLERWAAFAHVPVKDTNSTIKLDGMQELSNKEAVDIIVNQLGFRQEADGSFHRGDNESFPSLEEVRVYFRCTESLTPPVSGRRRSKQNEVAISDDEMLEFRLWAALSRTPLPSFVNPSIENEDENFATPAQGQETDNEHEVTETVESSIHKEEQGDSKETGSSEHGDRAADEFDLGHEDDYFPSSSLLTGLDRCSQRNRISMSPNHYQPLMMTQPEE